MKGQIYHLKDAWWSFLILVNSLKGRTLVLSLWGAFKQVCQFRKRIPEPTFGDAIMRDLSVSKRTNNFHRRDKSSPSYHFLSEWAIKQLCKIIYSHSIWHVILGAEHFLGLLGRVSFITCLPPQSSGTTGCEPLYYSLVMLIWLSLLSGTTGQ